MSNQDQQFIDTFTLVIGGLVAVAVAIFVLSLFTGGASQREARMADAAYLAEVEARLEPFGNVRLPGDAADSAGAAEQVAAPTPVATVLTGPQVYNNACVNCHGQGIGGAPVLTDAADWQARAGQGMETLQKHVLEGYQGSKGYMPPKGGRLDLSDAEILAALDFMLEEAT